MAITVEELNIKISTSAKAATTAVNGLASAFGKLGNNLKNSGADRSIKAIYEAINDLSNVTGGLEKATSAFATLNTVLGHASTGAAYGKVLKSVANAFEKTAEFAPGATKAISDFDVTAKSSYDTLKTMGELFNGINLPDFAQAGKGLSISAKTMETFAGNIMFLKNMDKDDGVGKVTQNIEGMRTAIERLNEVLEPAATNMQAFANACKRVGKMKQLNVSMNQTVTTTKNVASGFGKASRNAITFKGVITKLMGPLGKILTGKFLKSIARIGFYRAIRTGFTLITSSVKEGIESLYEYSRAMGSLDSGNVYNMMNQYTSMFQQMKNSIATAVAPALEYLMPVVQRLCTWFNGLANSVAQFFAALTGNSTYTVAEYVATEWKEASDSTDAANESAKEYKRTLLGFDQINALSSQSDSSSSSSSSSSTPAYADMFSEKTVENKYKDMAAKFLKWFEPLKESVSELWEGFSGTFSSLFDGDFSGMFSSLKTFRDGLTDLLDILSHGNGDNIMTAVDTIGAIILGWKFSTGFLKGLGTLSTLFGSGGTLASLFSGTGTVATAVSGLGSKLGLGTFGTLATVIGTIVLMFGGGFETLMDMWNDATEAWKGDAESVADGYNWLKDKVYEWIETVVNAAKDAVDSSNLTAAAQEKARTIATGYYSDLEDVPELSSAYNTNMRKVQLLQDSQKKAKKTITGYYSELEDVPSLSSAYDTNMRKVQLLADAQETARTTVTGYYSDMEGLDSTTIVTKATEVSDSYYDIQNAAKSAVGQLRGQTGFYSSMESLDSSTVVTESTTIADSYYDIQTAAKKAANQISGKTGFYSSMEGASDAAKSLDTASGNICDSYYEIQQAAQDAATASALSNEAASNKKFKIAELEAAIAEKTKSGYGINRENIYDVQTRASGGMVDTGSMFIAGEAGPELVGTINGRTGVVSAGEISGISTAVYASSRNETALLKEQNKLLSELISVSGNVTVSTNSVMNGINRKARRTGRPAFQS